MSRARQGRRLGGRCPDNFNAALQALRRAHGEAAHPVVADVLLRLEDDLLALHVNRQPVVDIRKLLRRKLHVHDGSDDLHNLSVGHFLTSPSDAGASSAPCPK